MDWITLRIAAKGIFEKVSSIIFSVYKPSIIMLLKNLLRRGHKVTPEVITENNLENADIDFSEDKLRRNREKKSIPLECCREKDKTCPNRFRLKYTTYDKKSKLENFSTEFDNFCSYNL